MKHIATAISCLIVFVFSANSKSLIGSWNLEKTKTTITQRNGNFTVRESGTVNALSITFKENQKVIFEQENGKTDSLEWREKEKRKIEMIYNGSNEFYKSFNGDFELFFSNKSKNLELRKNKDFAIFLKR
mgnify:CR=1 FL=1